MRQFFLQKPIFFYLLVLALPFGGIPVPYSIGLILLDFLIVKKWRNCTDFFHLTNPLIWLGFYFLLIVISLIWTSNTKAGTFEVQQKLSLLLLPLLVFANKELLLKNKTKLYFTYLFSISAAALFCFVKGFLLLHTHPENFIYKEGWFPFYEELSLFIHVTYFSWYILLGIAILFYLNTQTTRTTLKLVYLSWSFFFALCLYYLSSKGAWLAFVFLIGYYLLYFLKTVKQPWMYVVLLLFTVGIAAYLLRTNPRIVAAKKMATELFQPDQLSAESASDASNGQRIAVLNSSWHVIQQQLFFGVGAGDVIDELTKEYQRMNYKVLSKKRLNSHNQFIESWVMLGLIGFLVMLIHLFLLIRLALKNRFTLLSSFLLLYVIIGFTESLLNHQAGVVFYAFFVSLLAIQFDHEWVKTTHVES